jgi:hypothetical protein
MAVVTQLTLDGTFYRRGIAGDPIVIVSAIEEGALYSWRDRNGVFTRIFEHPDPKTGIDRAAIYVSQTDAGTLRDGVSVRITIDVRPETRGLGIRVVSVIPV